MGRGTQERTQHTVFLFLASLLMRGTPKNRIGGDICWWRPVRRGTDGQADGHHAAVCTVAAGLLAAGKNPLAGTGSRPATSKGEPWLGSRLLLEKIPLLILSAASAWITLMAQRPAERSFEEFPLAIRVENAVVSYGLYLWKMLWPARLALNYPHPACSPGMAMDFSALVLMASPRSSLSFAAGATCRLDGSGFWALWFRSLAWCRSASRHGRSLCLHPADRNLHHDRLGPRGFGGGERSPHDLAGNPGIVRIAGARHRHFSQISYWESDYDLWSHTLAVTERNPFAHNALAAALISDPTRQ